MSRPSRAAMRPVQSHTIAHRSAEELVDRYPEGFGFDVPQCQLDPRDRFVRRTAQVLSEHTQHVPVQTLGGARVLADEQILEVPHAAGHAIRIAAVAAFAPADDARVSFDFDERPGPPSGITVERLHATDSHACTLPARPRSPASTC